jgi:hypothetical protein
VSDAIEVGELTPELEPAYARFIAADPRAMIYGTLEFREFLRRSVGGSPHYLVARRGHDIVGAMPYFVATHPEFGEVINSLPWYGSHGGCQVAGDAPAARAMLLDRFQCAVTSSSVLFSTIVLTPGETAHLDEYRRALNPAAVDGRIGQVTELPEGGGDLERALESLCLQKTRNLVRKSRNQGFELALADTDEGWAFLYETHVENMRAIGGRAKPLAHFEAMRQSIPPAWRQLVQTRLEGQPVASMLLFRFNRTVEYITPVIKHEFRSLQPLSFAIWHGMIDAVRSGFRYWNWGGTWASQTTLHHFKAGWGATDLPYNYVIHASPHARQIWQDRRAALVEAFPYYFLFPFEAA